MIFSRWSILVRSNPKMLFRVTIVWVAVTPQAPHHTAGIHAFLWWEFRQCARYRSKLYRDGRYWDP